jgi:WD40 repeat protein
MEKGEIASFNEPDFHKGKIEAIKYSGLNEIGNCLLTASEDRLIKIWDRNSGKKAFSMQYRNDPFYSVDTNGQIIVGGTS